MYLLSARFGVDSGPDEGTSEHDTEMAGWTALNRDLAQSGHLVWSLALDDPESALVVTSAAGAQPTPTSVDPSEGGVFALYLLDVDEATALAWAARMPACGYGSVEVREVRSYETAR